MPPFRPVVRPPGPASPLLAAALLAAAWLGAAGAAPPRPAAGDAGDDAAARLCPDYSVRAQLGGPVRAAFAADGAVWYGRGPRVALGVVGAGGGPAWLSASPGASSGVLPGLVEDLAVRGPRAFVAAQRGGLLVLDLAAPAGPRQTARLELEGLAASVRLDGDRAYVTAGWGGLHVVDVAQPDAPRAVGHVSGIVSDAAVTGTWAFVVSRNLTMVDLTDPTRPVQRAKLAEWADAVELVDGVLFAGVSDDPDRADRRGQLASYDVRDAGRSRPQLGSLEVGQPVRDLLPLGRGRLLVLTRAELLEVDAADPARMRVLRRAAVPGHLRRLAGEGPPPHYAAGAGDGLLAIDGGTLALSPVPGAETLGHAASLAALDERTLVVEDEADASSDAGRLRIVDVADPSAPRVVAQLPVPVDQRALVAGGGRIVVGQADGGLRVVDASNPADPRVAGRLQLAGRRIWALALAGDLVWVANDDRLRAVDVSNPDSPVEVGSVRMANGATDVAVDGPRAYVAGPDSRRDSGFDFLQAVNIVDPTRPSPVPPGGAVDGWNDGLAAAGGLVAQGGLALYDVRGDVPPTWVGAVPMDEDVVDKAMAGGVVLLALEDPTAGTGAMRAVDVADPRRPRVLDTVPALAPVRDVAVAGGLVALAEGDAGLRLIAPSGVPAVPTAAPFPTRDPVDVVGTIYLPRVVAERLGCP